MILYPESAYKDAVAKNKANVVNNWMIPTFKAMRVGRIKAKNIDSDFDESDARKVRDSLRNEHEWRKFSPSADFLDVLYSTYLYYLDCLMSDYRILHKEPTNKDFYDVFEILENRMKRYR